MVTEITLIIASSVFVLFLLFFLFSFVLKYQRKTLSFSRERELMQSKFDQILLESQLEIQEQTLQQIGRELHDNLGQVASLIKINLHTIPLNDKVKAEEKLENTRNLTKQLIADIKSLSISLSSDRLSAAGLANTLKTEIDRINKTEQFCASIVVDDDFPVISNDKSIILYRMAQESLNNAIKHSAANNIWLKLFTNENLITLAVSDDGKGFGIEDNLIKTGLGLRNLQKRAALIDAKLSLRSSPGNGTHITIEMPYAYAPENAG